MTASTDKRRVHRSDDRGGPSPTRYDLVLAVIPTALIVAILVGQVSPLPTRTLLPAGALVGALALVDALFVNPPRTGSGEDDR